MPVPRNSKTTGSKQLRPGKAGAVENVRPEKEESFQAKRSPSSPQGAPKKRSAFGDITNAHKNQAGLRKKDAAKAGPRKAQKGTAALGVLKNNEINFKKSTRKTPPAEVPVDPKLVPKNDPVPEEPAPTQVPAIEDIDKEQLGDPYASAEYAKEIFNYMKEREEKFLLPNYMENQHDISRDMRAILVDWMVEVQERCPPCVDDFLYICDDAYKREELIAMEMSILRTLKFDINVPIPYRFLRRFAKCTHASMETLTLARFICEMTLPEYDYVQESASKLAASCLLLALKMKSLGGWNPTLEYYSGYSSQELHPLVKRLNFLLTYQHDDKLKAVRTKYSHRVFFEVAKSAPMDMLKLEVALKS
ncbi:G2/mitotic-specific cyclin-B3 isoform X2 [Chrysemys picta bellii]|uniref:G2/mitotic-specific cyclin-B3 isoform X2 n=1 Tax=Chrysemys picta bellii TaxID=8478 RepID=UPI0032B28A88